MNDPIVEYHYITLAQKRDKSLPTVPPFRIERLHFKLFFLVDGIRLPIMFQQLLKRLKRARNELQAGGVGSAIDQRHPKVHRVSVLRQVRTIAMHHNRLLPGSE